MCCSKRGPGDGDGDSATIDERAGIDMDLG